MIATAVTLPAVVVLVLLLNRPAPTGAAPVPDPPGSGPLPAVAGPRAAPGGAGTACRALAAKLPSRLDQLAGRDVNPAAPGLAAWGDPAVLLRCGVPKPAAFSTVAQNVIGINKVTWFVQPQAERAVWTVVDRSVYVEVSVPSGYASRPIVPLSDVVAEVLPAAPLDRTG